MSSSNGKVILGAGVTGLAAGLASGFPVFEAREYVGGICGSYYIRPGARERLPSMPPDGETYRFEYGGGHWLFGGDAHVLGFINSLVSTRCYERRSSVFFPDDGLYVPYPLQNHLSCLPREVAVRAITEIVHARTGSTPTLAAWLEQSFGPTLVERFFGPFHELYTAGLWTRIAPQDGHKSPAATAAVIRGALDRVPPVGYNTTYVYPDAGLNVLAGRMAERCDLKLGKRVVRIDTVRRIIEFADGSTVAYRQVLSTLPLTSMCEIAGISLDAPSDPYTSVLVVNIGATKGLACPADHWIYVPKSRSGFHRVGFYSNVDAGFLPRDRREMTDCVSIYVERAYPGGQRPSEAEVTRLCEDVVGELRAWNFIDQAEVVDPTWIDVAYTWSWPGSTWKQQALTALEREGIHQAGRYGRWVFQGIVESIAAGFVAGTAFRHAA
ncbi:MAG: protoporphyrinogen oxidase-like protein [Acidobacteria bacterium RIFCSPLOWO2_02_FULL_68_18]|nr:MAG: protoporphyrinogen oxidase-like protein [Acidobacteria bacterium RIFCSPLOWO2_02_FULL_68_18]OFW48236.1 MAG: protoporphyrinogen oxidase-like protein [Acidobacteria bacterium RIFCSPLOWO2_12_FULL_68_19]